MKKLINDATQVVADALRGIEAAHPASLRVDAGNRVVLRADAPASGKVGLVSGGGSGHEPLHFGFVGAGMLDAAACGEVFTSPTPDQILAATRAVDGGSGVLHIVKNYTGDVLNFELAAELAEADGITVRQVLVADDVAVTDSLYTAGRRGVAGALLVEKIAGAAAERGDNLTQVAAIAERAAGRVRSMGLALAPGTVPATGRTSFELAGDEIELGIGIHGEPGRTRGRLAPARVLAEQLIAPILADAEHTGCPVIALCNGMGGTPLMELYIMYADLADLLAGAGVQVVRSLVGEYVTSLEMPGCSLSLLRADDELLELWDAPVCTTALRW